MTPTACAATPQCAALSAIVLVSGHPGSCYHYNAEITMWEMSAYSIREEDEMILSKQPYRGYHLVLMQDNRTFHVRVLDESNNAVQLGLASSHSTEQGALDEARQKVDTLVGQRRPVGVPGSDIARDRRGR